jgi:hypothetical protein
MSDYELALVAKYRKLGVLVDTNLMLLYFIGAFDVEFIPRFKRTQNFSQQDYMLLTLFLSEFSVIATTPNILTEINSFANQIEGRLKKDYYVRFADEILKLEEIYLSSKIIARLPEFRQFGLTDAGILNAARNKYLVLTDDLKLSTYANGFGVEAMNFYHLREHF